MPRIMERWSLLCRWLQSTTGVILAPAEVTVHRTSPFNPRRFRRSARQRPRYTTSRRLRRRVTICSALQTALKSMGGVTTRSAPACHYARTIRRCDHHAHGSSGRRRVVDDATSLCRDCPADPAAQDTSPRPATWRRRVRGAGLISERQPEVSSDISAAGRGVRTLGSSAHRAHELVPRLSVERLHLAVGELLAPTTCGRLPPTTYLRIVMPQHETCLLRETAPSWRSRQAASARRAYFDYLEKDYGPRTAVLALHGSPPPRGWALAVNCKLATSTGRAVRRHLQQSRSRSRSSSQPGRFLRRHEKWSDVLPGLASTRAEDRVLVSSACGRSKSGAERSRPAVSPAATTSCQIPMTHHTSPGGSANARATLHDYGHLLNPFSLYA